MLCYRFFQKVTVQLVGGYAYIRRVFVFEQYFYFLVLKVVGMVFEFARSYKPTCIVDRYVVFLSYLFSALVYGAWLKLGVGYVYAV